jgi:hypothetical protein
LPWRSVAISPSAAAATSTTTSAAAAGIIPVRARRRRTGRLALVAADLAALGLVREPSLRVARLIVCGMDKLGLAVHTYDGLVRILHDYGTSMVASRVKVFMGSVGRAAWCGKEGCSRKLIAQFALD